MTNEDKEETLTLVLFTIAVACMGALYSGFITNPQDIAPNFAGAYIEISITQSIKGTILGLTNCIGSIPGFVAPAVASAIVVSGVFLFVFWNRSCVIFPKVGDDTDVTKWRTVWIITIAVLICEVTEFPTIPIVFQLFLLQVIQFFVLAKGEPQSWNNQDKASRQGKDWFLVSSIFFLLSVG